LTNFWQILVRGPSRLYKETRKEAVQSSLRVSPKSKKRLFATRFDFFIYYSLLKGKKNHSSPNNPWKRHVGLDETSNHRLELLKW
jgi:hypothetical protein